MNKISVESRIEKLASAGIKPGLSRVACLLKELGNPQHATKVIHVVGTNGKGTTAATIHNILLKSGYSVALYTSPHLVDFEERLMLLGIKSLPIYWHEALDKIEYAIEHNSKLKKSPPTFFELTTVAAILIMVSLKVEVAVVEAGMGGRFDATSIFSNVICSVICQIDIDHQQFLGNTLEEIAYEKFAVIRQGSLAIFYGQEPLNTLFTNLVELHNTSGKIFTKETCIDDVKCSLTNTQFSLKINGTEKNKYITSLLGTFAVENVAFAAYIAHCLMSTFPKIKQRYIYSGVSSVNWAGRFEIISNSPLIILDGGHNPHATQKLSETLLQLFEEKITLIVAMMKDKDVKNSLSNLKLLNANFIATEVPNNSRSMTAPELARIAREVGLTVIADCSPNGTLEIAKRNGNPIIILGSLFLVGYVKKMYQVDY